MSAPSLATRLRAQAAALRAQADVLDVEAARLEHAEPAPDASTFSVAEVAAKLGTSVRVVRRRIAAGKLHAVKLGREFRVRAADVDALLCTRPANDDEDAQRRALLAKSGIALALSR